ncbi:hypothetical protein ACPZ19_49195 [Amycolatopsis lurida]
MLVLARFGTASGGAGVQAEGARGLFGLWGSATAGAREAKPAGSRNTRLRRAAARPGSRPRTAKSLTNNSVPPKKSAKKAEKPSGREREKDEGRDKARGRDDDRNNSRREDRDHDDDRERDDSSQDDSSKDDSVKDESDDQDSG